MGLLITALRISVLLMRAIYSDVPRKRSGRYVVLRHRRSAKEDAVYTQARTHARKAHEPRIVEDTTVNN